LRKNATFSSKIDIIHTLANYIFILFSHYFQYQCETLKYEVREKTELLAEASTAIEELETRITTLTSEREDERRHLVTI
jgi:hypothetical protein